MKPQLLRDQAAKHVCPRSADVADADVPQALLPRCRVRLATPLSKLAPSLSATRSGCIVTGARPEARPHALVAVGEEYALLGAGVGGWPIARRYTSLISVFLSWLYARSHLRRVA